MTVKNKVINKDGFFGAQLNCLLGNGILFRPRTEKYLTKRKHISQAFYKNRNYDMQENLKRGLNKRMGEWISQIENSSEGRTTIDMA
jgi:hypothetical protein